ncbi:Rrf2 family transcriptional regulator [Lactobacillus terrae]|uniref:Rrf2 family transcriptional regulator n=1 Tax=Lactobacillus terrae TaxID=2269374 RepID=UPI000C1B7833|nr:Rrf2 family transcriptional regulator [Lactobacillus terrae]
MKYPHRLSDAVHILSYIEIFKDENPSSAIMAASMESNPSLVRRIMSQLSNADLLITSPGKVSPKLSRQPSDISLLDIYRAVDESGSLLHVDEDTNPNCLVGANIQDVLESKYAQVQAASEREMSLISLDDIISGIRVNKSNV